MARNRVIKGLFDKYLENFRIVSLTGPRQSGKTTFLKNNLSDYRYVNLEDKDTREFAENDTKGFLKQYDNKVIFDEAQRVPELFSYLQQVVDESDQKGQFVLSGSQNFQLSRHISQSLAGRVGVLNLFPYQYQEVGEELADDYHESILKGFYPEVRETGIEPGLYYKSYIQTYVKRDIYELLNIQNESTFKRFLAMLATHVGQELNLARISKKLGITHPTAKSWLSVLETSFLIYLLPPYHKSYNKRLVKSPKLYFYDTGLLCELLGIRSTETLIKYANRGSLFENLIIAEVLKQNAHEGKSRDLFFWKESNQTEIDLLLPSIDSLEAFEIKSSATLTKDKYKGLEKFTSISTDTISRKQLIHGGLNPTHERYGIETVSWRNFKL